MSSTLLLKIGHSAVVICSILLLSCGGEETTSPSTAPASDSEGIQSEALVVPGPVSDIVVDEDILIPADFPKDIPLYPDAQAAGVLENPGAGRHVIAITSPDTVGQITDYYGEALRNRDWDIEEEVALGPQSVVSARKGDRIVHVLIATNGMETVTTIKAVGLPE
jgi:hypothetical protein